MSAIIILVGIILGEGREGMLRRIANVGKCRRGFMAINLISKYNILLSKMTSTRPSWWWALRMEKLMAPSFSFMIKHFVIYRQWPGYHAGCPRPLGKDVSVRHCPITVVVPVIISI
jgi:hypothetical protein